MSQKKRPPQTLPTGQIDNSIVDTSDYSYPVSSKFFPNRSPVECLFCKKYNCHYRECLPYPSGIRLEIGYAVNRALYPYGMIVGERATLSDADIKTIIDRIAPKLDNNIAMQTAVPQTNNTNSHNV